MLEEQHQLVEGDVNGAGSKNRIIQAAVKLFSRNGYHATSVREIVDEAGVTKPVLYYYFKNKEDLFIKIISESMAKTFYRLKTICEAKFESFSDHLRAIEQIFYDHAKESPELVRFINSISYSGVYDDMIDFTGMWYRTQDLLNNLFKKAQDEKIIRNDLPYPIVAALFHGMILHKVDGIVYVPEFVNKFNTENMLIEVLLNGIAPKGESLKTGFQGNKEEGK